MNEPAPSPPEKSAGTAAERPQLLISVRSVEEARIALAAGADWIDVKAPAGGSLGAAPDETIAAVIQQVAGRAPISVAQGELREWRPPTLAAILARAKWAQPARGELLVKYGLSGCAEVADWPRQWRLAVRALRSSAGEDVRPVGVVYADRAAAGSPSMEAIFAAAIEMECPAMLVDTFQKDGRSLLDHWSLDQVASFCRRAAAHGMLAATAGSLAQAAIAQVVSCGAEVIAVRGAACAADRSGPIDASRIVELKQGVCAVARESFPAL